MSEREPQQNPDMDCCGGSMPAVVRPVPRCRESEQEETPTLLLTFDRVTLAPRPGSGRTCAGWADLLHFSGCRGHILVTDCEMSGTHDDAINVHGTHLRVVGRPAPDQVLVRFMHPQTYGCEAFFPGDEIEFVSHQSLRAYATHPVKEAAMRGDKEMRLTLDRPAPPTIGENDMVENITWTPSVTVRNCRITFNPCRGFLLTTRRPILIENNTFGVRE